MTEFTTQAKHAAAIREVGMRRRVYPRWVAQGKMTAKQAATEIAVMEAIAADYAEPDLFGGNNDAD